MNLKLEIEFSKAEILTEVDALKKQIDDMRPLPSDVEGRVMQKLRLDWNYHSNAIEGNLLSYGETVAFLMEGITAKGKPLKDHLDIRGHNEAINFLLSIVKEDSRPLSESDIRALHKMVLVEPYDVPAQTADGSPTKKRITPGEYKTSPNHVQTATGEIHYYATPEETPAKMQELMEWYAAASSNNYIHPIVVASLFHHKFVAIHPFDDGNGRLSRILMNLVLMQKGYPPVVVKMDDRKNYYALLNRADRGDSWAFVEYVAEQSINSLKLFLRAATGEDIDEEDDVDKEIALFKMELQAKVKPKKKVSQDEIDDIIMQALLPLVKKMSDKLRVFDEFFQNVIITLGEPLVFNFRNSNHKTVIDDNYDLYVELENLTMPGFTNKAVSLFINLLDFKNPDKVFDVVVDFHVKFDDEEYVVTDGNGNFSIHKDYTQRLSISEQNSLIKTLISDIKFSIDNKFK